MDAPDLFGTLGVEQGQHDELHGWEQVRQTAPLPLELQVIQHHEHRLPWPDGCLEGGRETETETERERARASEREREKEGETSERETERQRESATERQ